nr:sensor histidine kinase [uncultured Blautia sp.]
MKKKNISKYFFIFALLALCLASTYHRALYDKYQSIYNLYFSLLTVLAIAGAFYFLYSVTMNTIKDAHQKAELLALEQQQKLQKEQNQALAQRRQQTLDLQQDMKQKLEVYHTLMKEHDYDKASTCLETLTSNFQRERFRPVCNNNLINGILDSKRQQAAKRNIQTSFKLLFPEKMNIESSDLSSIFFNLMNNGIEACLNSQAAEPFIQITARQNANFLTIHMRNSKDPAQKFDHKTSKTDPWSHGFGLAIIEDIADRYDGSCQWIDQGDVFESVVMVSII